MNVQVSSRRAALSVETRAHRSTILRNPRVVVPPSQRIRNWRTLPVHGTGLRRPLGPRILEWLCNAVIAGFALLVASLCASKGWAW